MSAEVEALTQALNEGYREVDEARKRAAALRRRAEGVDEHVKRLVAGNRTLKLERDGLANKERIEELERELERLREVTGETGE